MANENDMTDEELDAHEEKTKVTEDRLDRLELFRRYLANTHIEKAYVIKRSQALGPQCPYYKKARRLFEEQQMKLVIEQMRNLLEEFKDV